MALFLLPFFKRNAIKQRNICYYRYKENIVSKFYRKFFQTYFNVGVVKT